MTAPERDETSPLGPESHPPGTEADSRFPSGPWTGFFLQPSIPGRHWMELSLTFQEGTIRGEGRDRVGTFLFVGRYDVADGKCWWTKRYIGQHDIFYKGYNEGKGIWGTWEDPRASYWRGGFHIWPRSMGDLTKQTLAAEVEEPVEIPAEVKEAEPVPAV